MKLKLGLLLPHWGKLLPHLSPCDSRAILSYIFDFQWNVIKWGGLAQPCDALENGWLDALIHERKRQERGSQYCQIVPKQTREFMEKASNLQLPRHVSDFEEDYDRWTWRNTSSQLPYFPIPGLQVDVLWCLFLVLSPSSL